MLEDAEVAVLDLLGEAATAFAALQQEHTADIKEFVSAIHAAQNIVLGRCGMRSYRTLKGLPDDWKRPQRQE
jgi:hypothetical protein